MLVLKFLKSASIEEDLLKDSFCTGLNLLMASIDHLGFCLGRNDDVLAQVDSRSKRYFVGLDASN